ncbi:MAG TPA: hydroxymethylbilane synthase, partial [Acidobacteriota bacterium]|nr:hydroxymethylbilane synthase [Acidobacteriota bacterium]
MNFTIATRGSKLALYQANFVQALLREKHPDHEWNIRTFTTTGDRILDRPLSDFGGKGVFLKEIEEAMLQDQADLAVHSLKDVPAVETEGLQLAAFLPREDPRDVWVSNQEDLMHLPAAKTVGTSSLRRILQVRLYRSDL